MKQRPPRQNQHALIVEDNDLNRELAVIWLRKYGMESEVVEDGFQALEKVRRTPFDVILMDVQIPGLDGLQVTALIREQEKATGRHAAILGITAHSTPSDREQCLAAGMDAFLPKPVSQRDLFATLDRLLDHLPAPVPVPSPPPAPEPESDSPLAEKALMERFRQDRALLGKIRDLFIADLPAVRTRLNEALADGRSADVAAAAHTLKGMIVNFEAGPAAFLATAIKTNAEAGNLIAAGRDALKLDLELERLIAALNALS